MAPALVYLATIALGLNFLAHHDTESGHVPLLIAVGAGLGTIAQPDARGSHRGCCPTWTPADRGGSRQRSASPGSCRSRRCWRRRSHQITPRRGSRSCERLVDRCRIAPMPLDDIERLALWCRDHTPHRRGSSGRPAPRPSGSGRDGTWRSIARAARIMARAWPTGSLALRTTSISAARRRSSFGPIGTTGMSSRRGTIRSAMSSERPWPSGRGLSTSSPRRRKTASRQQIAGPLELLHVEGRYAAYRVIPSALVHRQP